MARRYKDSASATGKPIMMSKIGRGVRRCEQCGLQSGSAVLRSTKFLAYLYGHGHEFAETG